ncbi:hypothetical protein V6U77_29755 [Micromonospora sp. CPCC 205546]|uniref:hypothetical protein n=1 Tax=Micromonospora sp. CPCC 205546 TaxID=3122397 RepID=UPI002FF32D31
MLLRVAVTVDNTVMTVRAGKFWWIVGVVVGLAMIALGLLLARAGLTEADRWASVIGVFVNIGGLMLVVYSAVQARRGDTFKSRPADTVRNTVINAEVSGPALLGRDICGVSDACATIPTSALADSGNAPVPAIDRGSAAVENRVEGGTFHGPLIMGRDLSNVVFPPPPSPNEQGENGLPR